MRRPDILAASPQRDAVIELSCNLPSQEGKCSERSKNKQICSTQVCFQSFCYRRCFHPKNESALEFTNHPAVLVFRTKIRPVNHLNSTSTILITERRCPWICWRPLPPQTRLPDPVPNRIVARFFAKFPASHEKKNPFSVLVESFAAGWCLYITHRE